MILATWNIERLKHKKKLAQLEVELNRIDADILILTEADQQLALPQYEWALKTTDLETPYYSATEKRSIIYSKYKLLTTESSYDAQTAVCPVFETPYGPLAVYGTIIGIHGNRRPSFMADLQQQVADIDRISSKMPICIAGDLNLSFSDNYYYTKQGRDVLNVCFERNGLLNLTASLPETIDHIVLSKSVVGEATIKLSEWNLDKTLSDHKGVCAEIG